MKRKRSHVGCLFWIALILLVLVVFLFNRPRIDQVLKSTGLTNLLAKQTPGASGPNVTRVPNTTIQTKPEVTASPASPSRQAPSGKSSSKRPGETAGQSGQPAHNSRPTARPKGNAGTSSTKLPPIQKVIKSKFQLYFVKIDSSGKPLLAPVEATVDYVNSPLTKTFDSLLEGVGSKDRRDGFRSLIPVGTRLLSASVRNGTAYLDFNDRFRFNSYGVEGYNAQLEQVVFTATQFPTVKRVQILLNGTVRSFLASEGIPINKPLARKSFAN